MSFGVLPRTVADASRVVNARDGNGATPVAWAVRLGDIRILKFLIANGADVNIANFKRQTPLHLACMDADRKPHAEIARLLIEAGANVNAQDEELNTPLMIATRRGAESTVRLLLTGNADPWLVDNRSMTALMHAAAHDQQAVLNALFRCSNASTINMQDCGGWTALHWAVSVNSVPCVQVLASSKRLNICLASKLNETALHIASRNGNMEIISILTSSDKTSKLLTLLLAQSDYGLTAAEQALQRGHRGCHDYLLQLQSVLSQRFQVEEEEHSSGSQDNIDVAGTGPSAFSSPTRAGLDDELGSLSDSGVEVDPSMAAAAAAAAAALMGGDYSKAPKRKGSSEESETELALRQKRRDYMRHRRQKERGDIDEMEQHVAILEEANTKMSQEMQLLRSEAARLRSLIEANMSASTVSESFA